jgi:two-component system nitrogen regulation response regulator GlnG
MAPAQVIEAKDLPPELLAVPGAESAVAGTADDAARGPTADQPAAGVAPRSAGTQATQDALVGSPWLADLERETRALLQAGVPEVWDTLTRKFEAQLIHTALEITRGRRIEAAQKLGIGRNTITRKIQDLGLE